MVFVHYFQLKIKTLSVLPVVFLFKEKNPKRLVKENVQH